MRKSFDGLCGVIRAQMNGIPTDGSVYVFINKRRDRIKLLHWEPDGFVLYYKRLEKGTLSHPASRYNDGNLPVKSAITWAELMMIIQGISFEKIKYRKRFSSTSLGA